MAKIAKKLSQVSQQAMDRLDLPVNLASGVARMELLGNRLEDGNMIFAYILSLRILEYERKILRAEPYPSQKPLPAAGDPPEV